jgi:hypothetical protein
MKLSGSHNNNKNQFMYNQVEQQINTTPTPLPSKHTTIAGSCPPDAPRGTQAESSARWMEVSDGT